MRKNYEFLEHTADVAIRVRAENIKGLFKSAALAMFDIIAERKDAGRHRREKVRLRQSADNIEELLINWLNELLYLSATREIIFADFNIMKLDKNNIAAICSGENINAYKINAEIKAATYHGLKIEDAPSGAWAEIVFDV